MANQVKNTIDAITNINEMDEAKYKKYFFIGLAIIIAFTLIGLAIGYMKDSSKEVVNAHSAQVYDFQEGTLKKFEDNKINSSELFPEVNALLDKVDNSAVLLPINSKIFEKLKNELPSRTNLMAFTEKLLSKATNGSFAHFFYTMQLSVLYEANKDNQKALETLKTLSGSEFKVDKSFNLEMGRLSLANNNKEAASKYFKKVISNFPDSEEAKTAYGFGIKNNLQL